MKKNYKDSKLKINKKHKYLWAFKMFLVAISLSLFFGFISQTLLTNMGIIVASIGISIFIFTSVIFDMFGIAVTSADIQTFEKWTKENIIGAEIGLRLCKNSEKVCSFCADVIGDICSTLCGAGGACIVVSLTYNITNIKIILLISISVSALIAGVTIFFKAIMKEKALRNSNNIILKLGKFLTFFIK